MSLNNAWEGRPDVQINNIVPDEGEMLPMDEITFDSSGPNGTNKGAFSAPKVAVDSSARYAEHDIVGGTTVRQKIGENPLEITVSGVCDEQTARYIDSLRSAKHVTLSTPSLTTVCQVASTSTTPYGSPRGDVDMKTGAILYEYDINLVGVSG